MEKKIKIIISVSVCVWLIFGVAYFKFIYNIISSFDSRDLNNADIKTMSNADIKTMSTENKTQDDVLIDILEKTNSDEITVGNTTISEVDNSKVCVDIDGVDENKVEDINVYQIDTDLDTNKNDEIDECLTSYIVDMKVEDSDESMFKTVSSGSSSKTMTSDGRIKIKSSIWYYTLDGTGNSEGFVGVKPYKVGGKIVSMPNSTTITSINGTLGMIGEAFQYPYTNSAPDAPRQTLKQTFDRKMASQTKSVSPKKNYYYLAGNGPTFVQFTYSVNYKQYKYNGTAKVTVSVDVN